jgi:glycine/D-amino acid oxidase-like deaminating enzyme
MTPDLKVLVVGAGIIGVSTAYYLSRHRSVDVTVCEQSEVAEVGATAKSGGLIRGLHMSDADLRLAAEAVPLVQDIARRVGPGRYERTGFAFLTKEANRAKLEAHVAKARYAGIGIAVLDRVSVRADYPDLHLEPDDVVAVEREAGYAGPKEVSASLAEWAAANGVRFRRRTRVTGLSASAHGSLVAETPGGRIEADVVVLANGIWSHHLGATAGVHVPIRSRPIGTATVSVGGSGRLRIPVVIDDALGTYYRPDGAAGMLFGVDQEIDAAGNGSDELDPRAVRAARDKLVGRIPRAAGAAVLRGNVGFEAYTPDKRPLVGWSGQPGVYLATGMSGGGFKISAGVGRAVATEIAAGTRSEAFAAYRPERFAERELIKSDYTYTHV